MEIWIKLISAPTVARTRLIALVVFTICIFVFVGKSHAAGRYLKIDYPASTHADELQTPVTYTLWIPDGVKTLRGIIVHQHGAGTTASIEGSTAAYDLHWQALAIKWDCALLGPSYHVSNEAIDLTPGGSELWFDPRRGSEKTFLKALDEFAAKSGHPEIQTVPWVLWGHSGGGIWADVMACLHPDRVAAMWLRSGSAAIFRTKPEFPQPEVPAAAYGIPTMCNPGMKEQFARPFVGTLATFQEFRSHGAPIGFAPDPRTGHECGDSRYLAIPFFDACLAMRLPDLNAANQTLKLVDMSHAWLAPLMSNDAKPAGEFKGDPNCAVWLPNETVAKAWMEYVKTGAVSDTTPPPPPYDVEAAPKGDAGMEVTWKADADFESGIRNFIVLRDGEELAQVPEKPVGKFGRPLFQSMTYHDTPSQPMPEMRYVDTSVKAGEKYRYSVITVNSVGLKSAPSRESSTAKQTSEAKERDMVLWYRQPGIKWLDAMPIGNGFMGAMVFGGIQQERIALNESSFWSARPHDYNDTNAIHYFPQIRDLVFAGKFQEAEKMADDHFWGIPKAQQAYAPIGDLLLKFEGADNVQDYRRELDMETGVAEVSYRIGDAVFSREVFMSYPERVMVVRISSDKPGRVSVQAQLKSPYLDTTTATPGRLVMDGSWKKPGSETNWLIAPVEGGGLSFETAMLARPEGGSSETTSNSLHIQGADAVTFILTTATSYINYTNISGNPAAICEQILSRSAEKDYATLRHRHDNDFRGLMSRVHLNVGDISMNEKPIDERLKAVRAGGSDPNLEALVFQFGRYILAASSRAGGQPANLQGIWNEDVIPPWGSKYTININTEMNYWPAEVCNLSECAQPLFDMIKDISVNGAETAKRYYGCGGWVTHHNIDLWRGTAPVDAARFGMWPVGGAWLCQHLWEHYAFTGDTQFLRDYYPVIKGAAQFLLEVMVEEPKHHWLVTPFSMSPEHGYLDGEGKMSFLSPSPTMDVGIIRELFPHCIEASRTLGLDANFRAQLETALTKIPPYQIGKSGFVQEWIEDWQPGPQGHNVSPNFPFYPGSSITLRGNPDFAAAYQKWMEAHPPRGGFPLSWGIAMWARLEHGDKVGSLIQAYVNRAPAANLHNAGANQSDASFGYTAAVAEALVQSHAGEISLLPALPPQWPNGSVQGLCARGGYEVSMEWKDGKLQSAQISNRNGGSCTVRYGEKTTKLSVKPGEAAHLNADLAAETSSVQATAQPRNYHFDKTISREVLENYLSRSITMEGLFNGRGDLEDDIRMLKSTGAKYIGRSLCLWNGEARFLRNIERARQQVPKALAVDPEMVLEACVFETVSPEVEQIPIPDWVFTALGQPVEKRNFVFTNMIYAAPGQRRSMGRNAQVPDESRIETQLWFYYQAASYIDAGFEGIHFGQVEIMNKNDPNNVHWARLLALVRDYAGEHARRHMVLCDGHVPTGGLMHDGNPLLDFNAFPLRIMETPDTPQEAILKLGFSDGIYNKSKGGRTFSGWTCDHLPYFVEFDNYGVSQHPGEPNGKGKFNWVWGYDEITWFAHQTKDYRAKWLQYAWDWVRKTDPNGYLEMPGSRTATSPDTRWYFANNPSPAVPTGLGDEEAIRAVWMGDTAKSADEKPAAGD